MKKIIISIGAAILLTGCKTSVRENMPATQFNAVLNGQPASFTGPKDFKADKIKFTSTTNGVIELEIVNIDCRLNPENISMTGGAYKIMREADAAHDAAVLKAGADVVAAIPK